MLLGCGPNGVEASRRRGGEEADARMVEQGPHIPAPKRLIARSGDNLGGTPPGFSFPIVPPPAPNIRSTHVATYSTHQGVYTVKTLERGP
jgi:hypothetical protein